jgi:hypothetical protein
MYHDTKHTNSDHFCFLICCKLATNQENRIMEDVIFLASDKLEARQKVESEINF